METDETFTLEMLPNPIPLRIEDPDLDFVKAYQASKRMAGEIGSDPMLLSWYDRKRGRYSPEEVTCGGGTTPWITFAVSRGADITIVVNDGEYVFIYLDYIKKGDAS
jgi:Domain of unknown function (DUF5619)